ncbi:MAG: hypothetical protein FWH14_00495 [Oscillospiraceae bacterium]|nr:hypothetical protein [Oscillospiraceae bacterium]
MARTSTKTSTKTYTRIAVLKTNMGVILIRAGELSEERKKLFLAEIENKTIKRILFYGYKVIENEEYRFVELDVNIDWCLHNQYVMNGEVNIEMPNNEHFANGITPDITAALNAYLDIIDEYKLSKSFSLYWSDAVYSNCNDSVRTNLREKLGLVLGSTPKWYGDKSISVETYQPREAKELTATINVVDDTSE